MVGSVMGSGFTHPVCGACWAALDADTCQRRRTRVRQAGAVIAGVTGGNALTAAVIDGAGGYFCRDLDVPGYRNK